MSEAVLLKTILDQIDKGVYTDLFMRPGEETRVKTPAGWQRISELAEGSKPALLSRDWLNRFVAQMCGKEKWFDELRASKDSQAFMFPFDPREIRMRCKVALCADPLGKGSDFTVNLRNLPTHVPVLDTLGVPSGVKNWLLPSGGLIIVTGQICSGKTTTLASLVRHINDTRQANIVTLELLTEYVHESAKSIVTQRTIPDPVPSFLQGIHDALAGQAVDVMMIGEVVDKPTMDAMLRAAESGHLVLATMHAKNAAGAISRIVDMFPVEEQKLRLSMLADKLIGVIAQKLLPAAKESRYVLAYELLRNATPAVAEAIKTNDTMALQDQILQGGQHGMMTLNQTLAQLVTNKIIDRNTALDATYERRELEEMLPRR